MTPYQIVPLSRFRHQATGYADWVTYQGGRVWLAKHGRLIGGLVSMAEIEKLEAFENRGLAQQRKKLEEEYIRWKRLKAAGHLRNEWKWEDQAPNQEEVYELMKAELSVVQKAAEEAWATSRRMRNGLPAKDPETDPDPDEMSDREIAELKARGAYYE